MHRAAVCAVVVLVLACRARGDAPVRQSEPAPPPAPPPPQQAASEATPGASDTGAPAVPDSANPLVALYLRLRALGEDRATIRARLGEPRAATREAHPNHADSRIVDTLVRWRYDGLTLTFDVLGAADAFTHDVLVETRAAADYAPIAPLTRELVTRDVAQARLGTSQGTMTLGDTTMLAYTVPGSGNTITLHFVRGRLVQVGAQPFLD